MPGSTTSVTMQKNTLDGNMPWIIFRNLEFFFLAYFLKNIEHITQKLIKDQKTRR